MALKQDCQDVTIRIRKKKDVSKTEYLESIEECMQELSQK